MITLKPFTTEDFPRIISWIDNQELLVTIAGTDFTFPLTIDQLENYRKKANSHAFNIVEASEDRVIGHAEILSSGEGVYKIDKLLIGEQANRGKGIGQQAIHQLLTYSFDRLNARQVELNVFDWNIGGIRCYEKCGFRFNPNKKSIFQVGDKSWTALNMTVDRTDWLP